jgi:beta-1,2-mannobiose phosphorylase / 1,2-beta-oligomannan phosphorylase
MKIALERITEQPILTANERNSWERASCFNAGAIKADGVVHLFYRATDVSCNGRENKQYMNYIGHAVSTDGIHFARDPNYVLGPEEGTQWQRGCEDPRVMQVDGVYYMLYTGYGARFPGDYRICMSSSRNLVHWTNHGVVLNEPNKDAALFPEKINGEHVLLHRRSPNICIGYSGDLKTYYNHRVLAKPIPGNIWEDYKIGIAGPPIKTGRGFVLLYHGVSAAKKDFSPRGEYAQYALGIMLLDIKDPAKVRYRQAEPILTPELDWELNGHVPNVVFSCGQVIMGDDLYVYYAGADQSIGVAKTSMKSIMGLFDI